VELPLFPLHTVLCPGIALPLHIFEERYRRLIGQCLDREEPFGVVLIRKGREVGPVPEVARVGTTAVIRQAARYPDGRLDIVTVGETRFRIDSIDPGREPYLVGDVELLDEPVGGTAERADEAARATGRRFLSYLRTIQPRSDEADQPGATGQTDGDALDEFDAIEAPQGTGQLTDRQRGELLMASARRLVVSADATAVSYLITGLVQVELPRRQELLEVPDTLSRLARIDALLRREIELFSGNLRPLTPDPALSAHRRN
jgi:Lon protease-like protein